MNMKEHNLFLAKDNINEGISDSKIEMSKPLIFMVRHGGSNYECEGDDITEQGEKDMEVAAMKLINDLNKERDIIILTSSPKARAAASARIMEKKMREAGFRILNLPKNKDSREKLAGMVTEDEHGRKHTIEGDEFNLVMDELWGEHISATEVRKKFKEWAEKENLAFNTLHGRTNTYKDVRMDVESEIKFANRATRFHLNGKRGDYRVVIIAVTHGEVMDTAPNGDLSANPGLKGNGIEMEHGSILKISN